MALQILINAVDLTSQLLQDGLQLEENMTDEPDIVSLVYRKFGARTYVPAVLDEVIIIQDAFRIFGGNIIQVQRAREGIGVERFSITCKDYSHIMDRYLVVERFQIKPAINIIYELMNRYINKDETIIISDFENDEIWDNGVADTTNYRTGTQGKRLTSSNAVVAVANRTVVYDLQPSGFAGSDYIDIDVYVDDITKLGSCNIRIGNTAMTSFWSMSIASLLVNGHNNLHLAKIGFASTGSPSWTNVTGLQLRVTSTASNTVNVSFDNWIVVKSTAFTKHGVVDGGQVVQYVAFNYVHPSKAIQKLAELFNWNWYVDPNKDIHYFDIFDETSPFDLSDGTPTTSGNYVHKSLELVDKVDQLRNAIYVRGGDYLAASLPDNISNQVDGVNNKFRLAFKYANYTLTVGGIRKAVGIDNIDSYTNNIGIFQNVGGVFDLNLGDVTSRTNHSQQVIATKHGARSAIKLRIRKVGSPVDNFLLQLVSSSVTNLPAGPNKSTIASLSGATLTTSYTEQTIALTEFSSASLIFDADQKYNINIGRSGAIDAVNYYQIDVANAGQYDGVCSTNNGTSWTANSYDFYFQELIDYNVLYNFQEKIITFPIAPTFPSSIIWTAQPYKPVLVFTKDYTSVSEFGEYQFKVDDRSIKSTAGAVQRANQELLSWADSVVEGSFMTLRAGLHAGQTININSLSRSLPAEDYLIKRVVARLHTPTTLEFEVTLVSKRTLSILYYLQKQLVNEANSTTPNDDEILEKVDNVLETITLSDSIGTVVGVARFWSNDAGTTPFANVWTGGAGYQWQ